MQTLEYDINGKRESLSVPGTLAEMDGDHFREATKMILQHKADDHTLSVLTGLPMKIIKQLNAFQRYSVESMFDFLYLLKPDDFNFKEWKMPTMKIGDTVYWGPASNFGNVTWQEFIYVDQCMMNGLYTAVMAALYRPERSGYDGETDRRIPFTIYGTSHRFKDFENIDEVFKLAVIFNYRAMRRASLEAAYPEIFPYHDAAADTDTDADTDADTDTPEEPKEELSAFSWTQVHRSLLGDRIEEEDKFLNLNVHTVLHRLNAVIVENRKSRK